MEPKKENKDDGKVYVSVNYEKLLKIDTVKEEYEAEIKILLRWKAPVTNNNDPGAVCWEPTFSITNACGKYSLQKGPKIEDNGFITQTVQFIGTLTEQMELNDFPFDNQNLSLNIVKDDDKYDFVLKEDHDQLSTRIKCAKKTEWNVRNLVHCEPSHLGPKTDEEMEEEKKRRDLKFHVVVSRRSGFYIHNIFLIMSLISMMSLATFSVNRALTQNRLQLTLILTLTSVAFKHITNQNIPKLSYMTLLDEFILVSMLYLTVVGLWHAVISLFDYDQDLQGRMDFWAFVAFASFYGLFQLMFWHIVFIEQMINETDVSKKKKIYKMKKKLIDQDKKVETTYI